MNNEINVGTLCTGVYDERGSDLTIFVRHVR